MGEIHGRGEGQRDGAKLVDADRGRVEGCSPGEAVVDVRCGRDCLTESVVWDGHAGWDRHVKDASSGVWLEVPAGQQDVHRTIMGVLDGPVGQRGAGLCVDGGASADEVGDRGGDRPAVRCRCGRPAEGADRVAGEGQESRGAGEVLGEVASLDSCTGLSEGFGELTGFAAGAPDFPPWCVELDLVEHAGRYTDSLASIRRCRGELDYGVVEQVSQAGRHGTRKASPAAFR
jgi:hypothetical protein